MGRLHLSVGTRYRWDGRTCVVVQVLRDGQLRVEDQPGGGQAVVHTPLHGAPVKPSYRRAVQRPGMRAR